MGDHFGHYISVVMVAIYTAIMAVWAGASSGVGILAQNADSFSAWVPAAATLIGLAALIWRLVTDTRSADRQDKRYEALIDELQSENERLRRLLAAQDDA
jgi:hypothetical protein